MKTCKGFLAIALIIALLVPMMPGALAEDVALPPVLPLESGADGGLTGVGGGTNDNDVIDSGDHTDAADDNGGTDVGDNVENNKNNSVGAADGDLENPDSIAASIELSCNPLYGTEVYPGTPLEIKALVPYDTTDSICFVFAEANALYEETIQDTAYDEVIAVYEEEIVEEPGDPVEPPELADALPVETPHPAFREFITYYAPKEAGTLTILAYYYALDSAAGDGAQKIEASIEIEVHDDGDPLADVEAGEGSLLGALLFSPVAPMALSLEMPATLKIGQECIGLIQGAYAYKITVTVTGSNGLPVPAGTKLTVERNGRDTTTVTTDAQGVAIFFEEVSQTAPLDRRITVYIAAGQGYAASRTSFTLEPVMVEAQVLSVVKNPDNRELTATIQTDSTADLTADLQVQVTFYGENKSTHSTISATNITWDGADTYTVVFSLPPNAYYAEVRVLENAGIRGSFDLLRGYWQAAQSWMRLSIIERLRDSLNDEEATMRATVSGISIPLITVNSTLTVINASRVSHNPAHLALAADNVVDFPVSIDWSGWTSGLPFIEILYVDLLGNHMPSRQKIEFSSDPPLLPDNESTYSPTDDYTHVVNLMIIFERGTNNDELNVKGVINPLANAKIVDFMDLSDPAYNSPQQNPQSPHVGDWYYATAVSNAPNARIEFFDKNGALLTITNPNTKTRFGMGEPIESTLYLSDYPDNDVFYARILGDRYTYTVQKYTCTSPTSPFWTVTEDRFHYQYQSVSAVYQLKYPALKVEIEQLLDHIMSFTVTRWGDATPFAKPITLTVLDDNGNANAFLVPYKHKFFENDPPPPAPPPTTQTWYPETFDIGQLKYFDTIMKNMDGDRDYTFILTSEHDSLNDYAIGEVKQRIYIEKIATALKLEKDPDNLNNLIATVSMRDGGPGSSGGVPQFGRIRVTSSIGGEWFYPYDPATGVCVFAIPEGHFDLTVQYVNKTGKSPEEVNPYGPYMNSPKSYWLKYLGVQVYADYVGTPEEPFEYDLHARIYSWKETINGEEVPTLPPTGKIEYWLNDASLITVPISIMQDPNYPSQYITVSPPYRYTAPSTMNFVTARYNGKDYPPSPSAPVNLDGSYPNDAADPQLRALSARSAVINNPFDQQSDEPFTDDQFMRNRPAIPAMAQACQPQRIYSRDKDGQVNFYYSLNNLPMTDGEMIMLSSQQIQDVYCYTFAFETLQNLYDTYPDNYIYISTPEFDLKMPFATVPTIPNLNSFIAENGLDTNQLSFTLELEHVKSEDPSREQYRLSLMLTDALGSELPIAPADGYPTPLTLMLPMLARARIERIDEETGEPLPTLWEVSGDMAMVTIDKRSNMLFVIGG